MRRFFFLSICWFVFHFTLYLIVDNFFISLHFSLHFLNNYSKIIFKKGNGAMFRTNRFITKHLIQNTKWYKIHHRKYFSLLFFSNPGSKYTSFLNSLKTGEKLIITSSVTKDIYIRPCISLARHQRQISKS